MGPGTIQLVQIMSKVKANQEVVALLVKLGQQALNSGDANEYLVRKLKEAVESA